MSIEGTEARMNTSVYKDYFEMMFDATDLVSSWWQPVFKGVGRSQLELSALSSKTAQSMLQWSRTIAHAWTPSDVLAANVELVNAISGHLTEALPKVSGAIADASQSATAFELRQLPVRRSRDQIIIPSADDQTTSDVRRVA